MMQKLLESKPMQAALEYLKEDDARTLKEHLELVAIPAPSNHVPLDVRMHYTITELPGPMNVVPKKAVEKLLCAHFLKKH